MRMGLSRALGALATDTMVGLVLFSLAFFVCYLLLSILVLSFSYQLPGWVFSPVLPLITWSAAVGALRGVLLSGLTRFPELRQGHASPSPWWSVLDAFVHVLGQLGHCIIRPRSRWHFVASGFGVGLLIVTIWPVELLLPAAWRHDLVIPTLGSLLRLLPHIRHVDWKWYWFFVGWNVFAALDIGLMLGFLVRWSGDFWRAWMGETPDDSGGTR